MKKLIENLTGSYKSSAKVVDGTLILSLPDAVTPTVWRLDLGQVKASAIEVRTQNDGLFILTLKTPKGDIHDIAPFDSRAKAVSALMAVSSAMENAQGQIKPMIFSANDRPDGQGQRYPVPALYRQSTSGSSAGKIAAALVVLVIIGFAATMILGNGPRQYALTAASENAALQGAGGSGNAANATGIPMSADDFLRSR